MKNDKPIIVFTTFWDAEFMIDNKFSISCEDNKSYILYLHSSEDKDADRDKPNNYSVFSIALMHPDLNKLPLIKEQFSELKRLDIFCPTFNMLKKYKEDKNWEEYTNSFNTIIRDRKEDIKQWVTSLQGNHIYILCCWENTNRGANCHRKLLYEAFTKSKSIRDKAVYIYKHGPKTYIKKASIFNTMLHEQHAEAIDIIDEDLDRLLQTIGIQRLSVSNITGEIGGVIDAGE